MSRDKSGLSEGDGKEFYLFSIQIKNTIMQNSIGRHCSFASERTHHSAFPEISHSQWKFQRLANNFPLHTLTKSYPKFRETPAAGRLFTGRN